MGLILVLLLCAVFVLVTVAAFGMGRRHNKKILAQMYRPADYEARLQTLKEQKKSGLISRQEFKQRKESLLGCSPEDAAR